MRRSQCQQPTMVLSMIVSSTLRLFVDAFPLSMLSARTYSCQHPCVVRRTLPYLNAVEDFHGDEASEDDLFGFAMDSFLRGAYDRPLSPDAPAPRPGLDPPTSVDLALRSLRKLDEPSPSHGAAVLQRFCLPLDRSERWGDTSRPMNPWKQLQRGSLTPDMLARKLRDSEFSGLLDWTSLDVTEGAYSPETDLVGVPSVAVVSAALHFGRGMEPALIVFTLRRLGGVWLIDSAVRSPTDLFETSESGNNDSETGQLDGDV